MNSLQPRSVSLINPKAISLESPLTYVEIFCNQDAFHILVYEELFQYVAANEDVEHRINREIFNMHFRFWETITMYQQVSERSLIVHSLIACGGW